MKQKWNRKTKNIWSRLLVIVLCCAFLCGMASSGGTIAVAEETEIVAEDSGVQEAATEEVTELSGEDTEEETSTSAESSEESTTAGAKENTSEGATASENEEYAQRVDKLLDANDETFVALWNEYNEADDSEEWLAYVYSLEDSDPATYNALGKRVDELVNSQTEEAHGPGGGGKPDESSSSSNTGSTSGDFDHIEIDVSASAKLTIDKDEYNASVTVTTSDTFYMRAYTLDSSGNKTYVTPGWTNATQVSDSSSSWDGWYTGGKVTTGDDSTTGPTVELSGSFSSGTSSSPIYYEVALVKDVTFTLNDGTTMTVPVTLTMTTYYWDSTNECPGVHKDGDKTNWEAGYFIENTGIDYPVSGKVIGQAITKGKLAIQKTVSDEEGEADDNSTETFTFTVQNSSGEYLTFSDNAYTGISSTLTDACKVTVTAGSTSTVLTNLPAGVYTITEIQKGGYIITDIDGESASNYSKDYTVTTKDDDAIPVANFTNAQLTNKAGISIAKVASGLGSGESYPDPTVSIYAYDSTTGTKTGDALWTGTLAANGDRLYLTTTLAAGTYIIEESGETLDGYDVTTSLSEENDEGSVNGLVFTVEAGTRYDLTVTNVYSAKPTTKTLTIKKTLSGNMYDKNKKFVFTITSSEATVSTDFSGATVSEDGKTVTVSLGMNETITLTVPADATITVTENADGYDYSLTSITSGIETTAQYSTTDTDKQTDATDNGLSFSMNETNVDVVINNEKEVTIDTGILLDSIPYIAILAIVAAGVVCMVMRRKRTEV